MLIAVSGSSFGKVVKKGPLYGQGILQLQGEEASKWTLKQFSSKEL